MEVKGEKVQLTSSEADWIQRAGTLFSRMPGLAQKVLDARIAFAANFVPDGELPTVRKVDPKDITSRIRLDGEMSDLRRIEAEQGADASGTERHIIEISMTPEEKRRLREVAEIDLEIARDVLNNFSEHLQEKKEVAESAATFFITSDAMEPQDALDLNDLLHDPEFREGHGEYEFEQALHANNVISGIMRALDAEGQ